MRRTSEFAAACAIDVAVVLDSALQQIAAERDTFHFAQQAAPRYAELVYYGQWFHPRRESMQTFFDHVNRTVTATVRLYKGRAMAVGATSPHRVRPDFLAPAPFAPASGRVDPAGGRG